MKIFNFFVLAFVCGCLCGVIAGHRELNDARERITSGSCGDDVDWTFDENTHILKFNGTGNMTSNYRQASDVPWYPLRFEVEGFELTGNITSIGAYTFYECANLKTVTIPETVKRVYGQAFAYCTSLTSLSISDSVTFWGNGVTKSCANLKQFNVSSNNPTFKTDDGVLFNKNGSSIIAYPCGKGSQYSIPESVSSIGDYSFSGCETLSSVELPNSITTIKSYAFFDCGGLKSINFPDSVTRIETSAFYSCSSLSSVVLPQNVSFIGSSAFSGCKGLKSINIPNGITKTQSYTFSGCSSLTSVEMPESLTNIELGFFTSCTALSHIDIPGNVTSIGLGAFRGCTSLKSLVFPESLNIIGDYAFQECTGLESIEFSENVTRVGTLAFSGCESLRSVVIPKSVTYIGKNAFSNDPNLESVIYQGIYNNINLTNPAFENCSSLLSFVCVPNEYNSTTFCGVDVGKSSSCDTITMENSCYKAQYSNNEWTLEKRQEAKAWENKTSGCVSFICDNETGTKTESKCDDTNMCIDDKCMKEEEKEDEGPSIVIEMEDTSYADLNITELVRVISEKTNLDEDEFSIAVEIDGEGNAKYLHIYVKSKEDGEEVINTIKTECGKNGLNCRPEKVFWNIKENTISGCETRQKHSFEIILSLLISTIIIYFAQ